MKRYFHTTGAAYLGTAHLTSGKGCEDSTARGYDPVSGVQTIALSDGAGTASRAHTGAEITAQMAAVFAAKHFEMLYQADDGEREERILYQIRRALFQHALKEHVDISDFSATLLLAAMHPDGRGFYLHIGDGIIIGTGKNGIQLLSSYDHQYANVTTFVTSVHTHCRTARTSGNISGFLLTSDGAEPYLMEENIPAKRLILLMQLASIVPEERMEREYSALTNLLQQHGMHDDASFSTLTSNMEIGNTISTMHPALRTALLGLPKQMKRSSLRKTGEVLGAIASAPSGMTISGLTRIWRTHHNSCTRQRLLPMIESGIIQYRDGRYYMHAGR